MPGKSKTFALDLAVFSPDYFIARERFLQACARRGGQCRSIQHPTQTYQGRPLYSDIYWHGPKEAESVLVVISGTHGVEGFMGSAVQTHWLNVMPPLPDQTALLLIHAINPFGFAYHRRANEDNIDLNRNFTDQQPENYGYQALAGVLSPILPDSAAWTGCQVVLSEYRERVGQAAFEQALSGGQYRYSEGLFYGGQEPSWSRRLLMRVIEDFSLAGRALAVIDLHSGLGPFGYGEIICDHPPASESVALAKSWYGDSVTEPLLGTSSSVPKVGLIDYAWHPVIGEGGCFVTLEFGTYSLDRMLTSLWRENADWWRYRRGELTLTQRAVSGENLRDFFYPNASDWREMVLFRASQVLHQALAGLSQFSRT